MNPEITIAAADIARVGEGPFWDAATGTLHWVDILGGAISSLAVPAGKRARATFPTLVGAAVPTASGGYVAATREGFAEVTAAGAYVTRARVLGEGYRMNDAKCDPHGRLWAGSTQMEFAAGQGALHMLDADWRHQVVLDGLTLPNGLGWSPDGRIFYLIDSITRELNAFATAPGDCGLSGRRVLTTFGEDAGLPDGMTVDSSGCLWIAMWGGGRILRVSPEGAVINVVPVPAVQPSSCAFGGPGLDVLYVTTAREGLDLPPQRETGGGARDTAIDGSVLAIRGLGVRGLSGIRFGG